MLRSAYRSIRRCVRRTCHQKLYLPTVITVICRSRHMYEVALAGLASFCQ